MTGAGQENATQQTPGTPAPSFEEGAALLARSRLLGRISACIFILAVIAVLDGLQTLVRHEFNSVSILPGEQILISGMLPGGTASHEEIVARVEGAPHIRFTPLETYKGFWMGGHMWRARLEAPNNSVPGRAVITVEDILPAEDKDKTSFAGQQNPALVYAVTVFASESERRAADNSLIRRFTGLPAFGVAGFAVICALLCGLASWLTFGKSEKALAGHGVFFIHGVKMLENTGTTPFPLSGYKVAFAHAGKKFYRGEPMILYDGQWRERGRGSVIEVSKIKGFALFPLDGTKPEYGWLAARESKDPE